MSNSPHAIDELIRQRDPDRVHYEVGTMLGREDFLLEQTYHRGRLARALAGILGQGTVAGLEVDHEPADAARNAPEEIVVYPGLALDRLGRMIEIPRRLCLRLDEWYRSKPAGELAAAFHPARNAVVADLFLRFVSCERGRTPILARDSFDGLSAVAPSRVRDAWELLLMLRPSGSLPVPSHPFPATLNAGTIEERRRLAQDAILAIGRQIDGLPRQDSLPLLREHLPGMDPTAELIARIDIPAVNGNPPVRQPSNTATIDNHIRRFAWPSSLLARFLDLTPEGGPNP